MALCYYCIYITLHISLVGFLTANYVFYVSNTVFFQQYRQALACAHYFTSISELLPSLEPLVTFIFSHLHSLPVVCITVHSKDIIYLIVTLFYTYCILIGTLILLETCNFIDMSVDNRYSYITNVPLLKI